MMRLCFLSMMLMASLHEIVVLCEEAVSVSQVMSQQERDARIKDLQKQIKIYRMRALYADREGQRLMTLDFLGYRQRLIERDKYLSQMQLLQEELADLQKLQAEKKDTHAAHKSLYYYH